MRFKGKFKNIAKFAFGKIFVFARGYIADNTNPRSLASWLRRKRAKMFEDFALRVAKGKSKVLVLDIGCGPGFSFSLPSRFKVVGLNIRYVGCKTHLFVVGDARALPFKSKSIDIVFSNSLIEHIFPEDRKKVADEIRRVARAWFVQTPYRFFPIEPHYLLPFVSFPPPRIQRFLRKVWPRKLWFGWYPPDEDIFLLSLRDVKKLFPESKVKFEFFGPFPKSIIVLHDGD